MKRITEVEAIKLKLGSRLVFMDKSGEGCRDSVNGEVYKLIAIEPYRVGPTILTGRSLKTGTEIMAYYRRFSLHTPMMEENE